MPADRLDDYEAVGVVSTDFKATKPQHEAALMELADAVGAWAEAELDDEEADPDPKPITA
jgi:hypothetical protein